MYTTDQQLPAVNHWPELADMLMLLTGMRALNLEVGSDVRVHRFANSCLVSVHCGWLGER